VAGEEHGSADAVSILLTRPSADRADRGQRIYAHRIGAASFFPGHEAGSTTTTSSTASPPRSSASAA